MARQTPARSLNRFFRRNERRASAPRLLGPEFVSPAPARPAFWLRPKPVPSFELIVETEPYSAPGPKSTFAECWVERGPPAGWLPLSSPVPPARNQRGTDR